MNYKLYEEEIRRRVCEHCIDYSREKKQCTFDGDLRCGVETYLEKIVEVVHAVHSSHLEDYIRALREKVCAHCKNQNPDGSCHLRENIDCGLDRYFALIIESIEAVDERLKHS